MVAFPSSAPSYFPYTHGADPQLEPVTDKNPFASYPPSGAPGRLVELPSENYASGEPPLAQLPNADWLDPVREKIGTLETLLMHDPPPGIKVFEPVKTNYVRLETWLIVTATACGGSLIASDVVATASHCIPEDWNRMIVRYGRDFAHTITVVRNDDRPNWARIRDTNPDSAAPNPDLALIQLPMPLDTEEGAQPATIPGQDECENGVGRVAAYRKMGLLPREFGIQHAVVSILGRVGHKGWALITYEDVADKGDSGSPLMSMSGKQVGVHSGDLTYPHPAPHKRSYAIALCKYSDAIKAQIREFSAAESRQTPAA